MSREDKGNARKGRIKRAIEGGRVKKWKAVGYVKDRGREEGRMK